MGVQVLLVILTFGEVRTTVSIVQNCGDYARKAEASRPPMLEDQSQISTGFIAAVVRF